MKERFLSILLCLSLLLTILPVNVVMAEGDPAASGTSVTKDIAPLLAEVELVGAEKAEDGAYHVPANQPYAIKLVFRENADLQMDMSDYIRYALPAGIVANDTFGTIEIGVNDADQYTAISHDFSIADNTLTITWNQEHEAFDNLARSPIVYFSFYLYGIFDGSEEEVRFEDGSRVVIELDTIGTITVNKLITGLKPEDTLTDAQKQEMTFELRNANGQLVRAFTYADMTDDSITFPGMTPGDYTVVETGHPDLSCYTFDTNNSVTTAAGTLSYGSILTLSLTNDYIQDKGHLQLNKIIRCTNWDQSTTVPDSIKYNISFRITGPYGYNETFPYAYFSGEAYTVTGLDVGEYTVTEIDSVTGYTCTHQVNGIPMDTPTATVTVTKGDVVSVSFENTYTQKTANLTVRKTASGAIVPENTEFTVTFPDGTTTRTFKYSDMTDGAYVLSDVPLGTYHVSENKDSAQVANYALTVTGEGDITLSENGTKEIHNTYVLSGGTLKINKIIAGDLTSDALTDEQKEAMTFTVTDAAGAVVGILTYADTLEGRTLSLPVGTYTVKESGADILRYSVSADPANGQRTVSISAGETTEASFTNTYTLYRFTVVKRCAEGSDYSLSNLPDSVLDKTIIAIRNDGKNQYLWRDTLRKFLESPDGIVVEGYYACSVIETNPTAEDIPGIGVSTRISIDGGSNYTVGNARSFNLRHTPQGVTVIIENTYTLQGTIKVDKTVAGLSDYEESRLRDRITYSVYHENGGVYSLYKENVTLAEMEAGISVPVGNYYVQETGSVGVNGYAGPEVKTQVNSGAVRESSNTDNFAVTTGGTVTVHFTNTYNIGTDAGTVKLTKYVKGLDEIGSADEIELTSALEVENTEGQLLYDGIQFIFEILTDGTWYEYDTYSLSDFASGISLVPGHYRMTESSGNVEGYFLHVDYLIKSEVGEATQILNETVEFDIAALQALDFEAHNVYTKVGNLKITKTTAGDVTGLSLGIQELRKILFTVTGPFDFEETFSYYDIFSAGAKEYIDIPVGDYTVTETAGDISGFLLTVSSNLTGENAPKSGTVTVSAGMTTQVDFTNTYTYKTGTLILQKTMDGDVPETLTAEQKEAMKFLIFRVEGGNDAPTYTQKYEVTYNQFVSGSYTIPNVPVGTYMVAETLGEVLTDDYYIDVTGTNVNSAVTYGQTTTLTVHNAFTKKSSLKLVKIFEGLTISQQEMNQVAFTYWQVGANGEKIGETTVTYADFTGGSYVVKGLVPGNYRVAEGDNETVYRRSTTVKVNEGAAVSGTGANVIVSSGVCTTVVFTNTYAEKASLQILKANEGALTRLNEEQAKAIVFTVLNSEGNTIYKSDWHYMGGRSIGGLAPGEYTVTETIEDPNGSIFGEYSIATRYQFGNGAEVTGRVAHITLLHGTNTIVFTNTYTKVERMSAVLHSSKTYVGMTAIDGVKYPVWQFTLSVSNLNPQTTADGTTVFTDVFDTLRERSLFRLATAEEVSAALGYEEQNAYLSSKVAGKEAPTAVFDENSSAIVISNVTADTADKCDFTYYLIVRDREALQTLQTPQPEGSSGVEYNFNNQINYHPIPGNDETTDTAAEYEYRFSAISKDIANLDEQGFLYHMVGDLKLYVNYANYTVILNPEGITLGDQPTIIATDTFSENQAVVLSGITANPSDGVSFTLDNDAHQIIFTIPNSTPVTVSYRADVIEKQNPVAGTVRLTNEVSLLGFGKTVDETVKCSINGEGQGDVYSVNLKKVDALDGSIGLEGVCFALYDGVTDERLTEATTDASGLLQFKFWGIAGALVPDYTYYIKEESTIDGYHLGGNIIWFRITDSAPGSEDNVLLLTNGSTLVVSNHPVTAAFEVTKEFNDWTKQGSFSFQLEALDGAPMPAAGGEIAVATEVNSTACFGLIRFPVSDESLADGKVVTYHYTIREVSGQVPGITYDTTAYLVTVVISDTDHNGVKEISVSYDTDNKDSLIVTNRYSEGALVISKTLRGNDVDPDKEFVFTVRLAPALSGTYSGVAFTDGVATISLKGGESKTIEGLPCGTAYTVTESDYTSEGYTLTAKSGDTGTITEGAVSVASFTNTKDTTVPTGDNTLTFVMLAMVSAAAIVRIRRKQKENI